MDRKRIAFVKRVDRAGRFIITLGGVTIILSLLAILVLIVKEALPLFRGAEAEKAVGLRLSEDVPRNLVGAGLDPFLETAFVLDSGGTFHFFDLRSGKILRRFHLDQGKRGIRKIRSVQEREFTIHWRDGGVSLVRPVFKPFFDEAGRRSVSHEVETLAVFEPDAASRGASMVRCAVSGAGAPVRVVLSKDHRLHVTRLRKTTNVFGEETTERVEWQLEEPIPGEVGDLVIDGEGKNLIVGTRNGYLMRWVIGEEGPPRLVERFRAFRDGRGIQALRFLLDEQSIAVADSGGGLTCWFPVREPGKGRRVLRMIHPLETGGPAIHDILPGMRSRCLFTRDEEGRLGLYHATTERRLLSLSADRAVVVFGVSDRDNAVMGVDAEGRVTVWSVDNPHPETTLGTLFGKVWYEGYDGPEYVWQSSAGHRGYEPKFSLVPLVFGTLKGTLYAMVLALPLAILGALYTSQLMTPGFRRVVKPAIEIMAAVPSVVVGFLAALWFAPIVERWIVSLLLALLFVPAGLLLACFPIGLLTSYEKVRRRVQGYEFAFVLPVLAFASLAARECGGLLEETVFGGDFKLWLFQSLGERYDPRNCVVIAFALGFAVIPIIFTISEDALSNVPRRLSAASLALGASRWQTVWRVMLPSAAPGIFAAGIIGLGRAVGETMIVLMATGNTPIVDWSPFNGMRTLSANIAVEIPEAPTGGTLYRVLFLSAALLFISTFVLNTVAEIVRHRLRSKYMEF